MQPVGSQGPPPHLGWQCWYGSQTLGWHTACTSRFVARRMSDLISVKSREVMISRSEASSTEPTGQLLDMMQGEICPSGLTHSVSRPHAPQRLPSSLSLQSPFPRPKSRTESWPTSSTPSSVRNCLVDSNIPAFCFISMKPARSGSLAAMTRLMLETVRRKLPEEPVTASCTSARSL